MQLNSLFVYSERLTFTFEEVGGELMDMWGYIRKARSGPINALLDCWLHFQ